MKTNIPIESGAGSEPIERTGMPADWNWVEEVNDCLVLRRWIDARVIGLVALALSVLTLTVLAARYSWNPLLTTLWGLDWVFLIATPAIVWLDGVAIWARWGSETWRFEPGLVTRTRTLLGKQRVRRMTEGHFELVSSCGGDGGSEARWRLLLRASNQHVDLAEDRFDENVRAFGLTLSKVTGFPIRTVN